MKRIIQVLIIISLLMITITPHSASAQTGTTFYVSTTGNNTNLGSQSSPFKTIQRCIAVAKNGDTCSVQAGTYNERINVLKAITVVCIAIRTCIIKGASLGSNATIDGFYSLNSDTNEGGITGSGSRFKILNNKIEGSCMVGVELNGQNGLAEGNEILKSRVCSGSSGPDADGMRFFGSGHILRGNYIHDIVYNSVNANAHIDCFQTWSGASNTLIENNICDVFTANSSRSNSGANLEDDTGTIFRHNYIRSYGKKILFESSSRNGLVEFNIFVGGPLISGAPTQYGLFAGGNNETARNNLFWDIRNNNGTSDLFGIDNVSDNLLDVDPQMNGYCSRSHPELGVPCGVTPTSTSRPPTAIPTSTRTRTATALPVVTNTFIPPTSTSTPTSTTVPIITSTPIIINTSPVITNTLIPTITTVPSITSTFIPPTETFTLIPTNTNTAIPTITSTPTVVAGPYVLTSIDPVNISVGNTGMVSVSLNNIPVEGYSSAEFTCTYNPSLVGISNINITGLFGTDPVSEIIGPQNGSFILAIAGSNRQRATVSGTSFTFNIQGLQTSQTTVECTARVSMGLGSLTNITSIPANITISGAGTVEPAFATLIGQVIANKLITITLYNADSTFAASTTANQDGTFTLIATGGTYTVIARANGFLSAQGTVTLFNGNISSKPVVSLPAGDVDGNNVIDQFDAMTIGMNFNNSIPTEADLNNDGIINVLDLEILAQNYRKSGALAW